LFLFVYYSIILDNTDISTLGKGKAFIFINGVEVYSKEALNDKIHRLITANVQLMTDKTETEKTKVNLKADKVRLFDEKNSLIVKRKKLRIEIVILNATGPPNVLIRRYQDPFLRLTQDKLKTKRPLPFDGLKKNFQRFFTGIRYYQGFYQ